MLLRVDTQTQWKIHRGREEVGDSFVNVRQERDSLVIEVLSSAEPERNTRYRC